MARIYPDINKPMAAKIAIKGLAENDPEMAGRLADELLGDAARSAEPKHANAFAAFCWDLGRRLSRHLRHIEEANGPLPRDWVRPNATSI